MKYLVFDVETSGLPDYAAPADDLCQPRVAEFAGFLLEEVADTREIIISEPYSFLVKPDGWDMHPDATAVNGLTTAFLHEHGRAVGELLHWYTLTIQAGYVAATYNARHDCKMMRGELRRAGMDDLFEQTPNTCLMRACQKRESGVTKAAGKRGWPSLADACRSFGLPVEEGPHRAITGAEAALGVFKALNHRGLIMPGDVHYAKAKPLPDQQIALPRMDF
jgi:DNA polymerase III epsilon subunit-like protein